MFLLFLDPETPEPFLILTFFTQKTRFGALNAKRAETHAEVHS